MSAPAAEVAPVIVAIPAIPPTKTASPKKILKKVSKGEKTPKTHPGVALMIKAAIFTLKERNGSSVQAIKKYIQANYKVDIDRMSPFIKKHLKSATAKGLLVQTKGNGASGSFKLSKADKEKKKATKAVKKIAKKPTGEKKTMKKKVSGEKKTLKDSKKLKVKKATDLKKPKKIAGEKKTDKKIVKSSIKKVSANKIIKSKSPTKAAKKSVVAIKKVKTPTMKKGSPAKVMKIKKAVVKK